MKRIVTTLIVVLVLLVSAKNVEAYRPGYNDGFFQGIEEIELQILVFNDVGTVPFFYRYDAEKILVPLSEEEIKTAIADTFKDQFSQYGVKTYRSDEKKKQSPKDIKQEEGVLSKFDDSVFNFDEKEPPKRSLEVYIYVVLNSSEMLGGKKVSYGAITTKSFKDVHERYPLATNLRGESFPIVFVVPDTKEAFSKALHEATAKVYQVQRREMLCRRFEEIKCHYYLNEILEDMRKAKDE